MKLPDIFSLNHPRISRLPGIRDVGYVEAGQVGDNSVLAAVARLPIYAPPGITWLNINGLEASCEAVTELQNNCPVQTTTLTFNSPTPLPDKDNLVFIVATPDDKYYLIGRREAPKNKITATATIQMPANGKTCYSYEVVSVARRSLIRVIL